MAKSKTPDVLAYVNAMSEAVTFEEVLAPAFRMWMACNPTRDDGEARHAVRLSDVGTAACLGGDGETVVIVPNVKFRDVLLAASPTVVPMNIWEHLPSPLAYSRKGFLYDASTLPARASGGKLTYR